MATRRKKADNGGQEPGGMLDLTLVLVLLYAVYAMTPFGALVETGARWAWGDGRRPDLFATFSGRVGMTQGANQGPSLKTEPTDPAILRVARASGAPSDMLTAWVDAFGSCNDGECEVAAPPSIASAGSVPLADAAVSLASATDRFQGDWTLGLESLFVGEVPLRGALAKARESTPESIETPEVHGQHLPPTLRRGAFTDAMAIIGRHRLVTLSWPASTTFRITSPFGMRTHPVTGKEKLHNGTDIGCPTGTPLSSPHRGQVSRVGSDSISGKYLKLDHGTGIETTFCHLSSIDVEQGQWVQLGQIVAASGATGRITGPHLHYILRIDGEPVDAMDYGHHPTR